MIDKQHNKFVFICDECGDGHDTEEEGFYAALARVKEEGWVVKRNDDDTEWVHICNECVSGR